MKRFWFKVAQVFTFPIIKVFFPTKVINKKKMLKKETHILISNHLSFLDIPLLWTHFFTYRHFLAKEEFKKNVFARFLFWLVDVITIDRNKADLNAIKRCLKALKNNESLTVFPEGTRNKDSNELQEVKGGVAMIALKANVRLVPISINNKEKAFRKNYVYVGEPFSLDDFKGERMTSEIIEKANNYISKKMQENKEELNKYLEDKKQKKLDKKFNKKNKKKSNNVF